MKGNCMKHMSELQRWCEQQPLSVQRTWTATSLKCNNDELQRVWTAKTSNCNDFELQQPLNWNEFELQELRTEWLWSATTMKCNEFELQQTWTAMSWNCNDFEMQRTTIELNDFKLQWVWTARIEGPATTVRTATMTWTVTMVRTVKEQSAATELQRR